ERELEQSREGGQHHLPDVSARLAPRQDHSLENRDSRVTQQQVGARNSRSADTVTVGTGSERRVERELTRLQLRQREPALGACKALAEQLRLLRLVLRIVGDDLDDSVGDAQCSLE